MPGFLDPALEKQALTTIRENCQELLYESLVDGLVRAGCNHVEAPRRQVSGLHMADFNLRQPQDRRYVAQEAASPLHAFNKTDCELRSRKCDWYARKSGAAAKVGNDRSMTITVPGRVRKRASRENRVKKGNEGQGIKNMPGNDIHTGSVDQPQSGIPQLYFLHIPFEVRSESVRVKTKLFESRVEDHFRTIVHRHGYERRLCTEAISTAMSEFLTPEIRLACPTFSGLM